MTKRKPDERETDYLRRKLRKLEKKMKKLPSESASLPPPPQAESPVPLSPPSPPVIREPTPRRMPVNAEESSKNNAEDLIIEDPDVLPEEFLLALGTEGQETEERGPDIRPELSARWNKLMATGLGKEALDQIVKKYPAPANFSREAPKLNPEISASCSEISIKRDKRIIHRQNLTLKAMNALAKTLTSVLKGNISANSIVEQVNDAAKLCAEIFYEDSTSRRFFALAGASPIIREAVRDAQPDEFLFGKDCAEKIKAAQAIKKTGTQIKNAEQQASSSTNAKPAKQFQPKRQGNWRGPPQQYQYQHQRTRGGHRQPPTTKKYSQPHQSRQEQRRHQNRGRHTYRR